MKNNFVETIKTKIKRWPISQEMDIGTIKSPKYEKIWILDTNSENGFEIKVSFGETKLTILKNGKIVSSIVIG